MTKSNTARTDDRRVQKQANKVYSESNPYRTGVGDSPEEDAIKTETETQK
jgi:hypothetical protein